MEKPPFIVFALPRSRTYWTSRFLSSGGWWAEHDAVRFITAAADIKTWLSQPKIGCVETAAAPFWRSILRIMPGIRVAVIRRPVEEVAASIVRAGGRADITHLRMLERKLDQIEHRVPGVLSVGYDELNTARGCEQLFEHCLGEKMPLHWWYYMKDRDLQVDLEGPRRFVSAFLPRLEKLARQLKQSELFFMARAARGEIDGVAFQLEQFDQSFVDAAVLLRQHMVAIGADVEDFQKKNIPLLSAMGGLGVLQTAVARCNGRMVGYLITVHGDSADERGVRAAEHMSLFADPAFPGVGLKLTRFADEQLRLKGVGPVLGRAGVVGSGPRMGAVWRRLGYNDFGSLYRRDLRESA